MKTTSLNLGLKEYVIALLFAVLAYATNASVLEIIASLTGLLCVWLNARENIWNYPFGFVNAVLFGIMFFQAKLYADMMLQGFFILLMIYGLVVWLTKRDGHVVRPTRSMTRFERYFTPFVIVGLTFIWGALLSSMTDASIPFLDAFIATLSVVAQWFLSKKVLENWVLWIIIDVLSVGMYIYKDLYIVAFTYLVFLVIATYGYISWKKEFHNKKVEIS